MAQSGEQRDERPDLDARASGAADWISDVPLGAHPSDAATGVGDPDVVDLRTLAPGSLAGRTLRGVALREASLGARDLTDMELERCDLSGADLRRADIRRAWIIECRLRAADLDGLVGGGLVVIGSDLHRVTLRDADLRDTVLVGCDLREADLGGCDLRGAVLTHVDLRGANLVGADLDDADIEAFWDETTRWPLEEPLGT